MRKLRVLDLFSGIGGFSLGLERTGGFETVAFCEIEPFPRKVLAKHWPKVPIYDDVRTLTKDILDRDGIAVDVICGGFPCQDISTAGKGVGIAGSRSGLWKDYARLIGELRPQFAIMENVSALLGRGLDVVLGDLAEIGFDAEWHCIPASAVGAPHRRDRIWIVAHSNSMWQSQSQGSQQDKRRRTGNGGEALANAECPSKRGRRIQGCGENKGADGKGPANKPWGYSQIISHPHRQGLEGQRTLTSRIGTELYNAGNNSGWAVEPNVGRVAHGVPNRVDRLKALGNAVVPQIPELIGNAILQSMRAQDAA